MFLLLNLKVRPENDKKKKYPEIQDIVSVNLNLFCEAFYLQNNYRKI